MYYTSLPNHNQFGFDKQVHFNQFRKYNIIFNSLASKSFCENHAGCLCFKTVFGGEVWSGLKNQQKPCGRFFLMLNIIMTIQAE